MKTEELVALTKELITALQRCGSCKKMAEYICFDAAGDICYRCENHKFKGGMLDGDEPLELKYAPIVRKIERLLEEV